MRVALTNYCGGFRVGTGGRLLTALTQVRFLPPQLSNEKRKGKPTGDGSRLESGRARERLDGFNSLTFRSQQHVLLAERQRLQASNLARRVRLPQGTLGDRLMVGRLPLKQVVKVRVLLPELANPSDQRVSLIKQNDAG